MVARWLLCAALLLPFASPAHALCRDDINELKPRIDRIQRISPDRYYLSLKWFGRAVEAEPGSETECLNYLARARRALTEQLPQVADCLGSNAYLPQCTNPGAAGGPVAAAAGLGGPNWPYGVNGQFGGGGGGAPPFNPPGSTGQTCSDCEATGSGRTTN